MMMFGSRSGAETDAVDDPMARVPVSVEWAVRWPSPKPDGEVTPCEEVTARRLTAMHPDTELLRREVRHGPWQQPHVLAAAARPDAGTQWAVRWPESTWCAEEDRIQVLDEPEARRVADMYGAVELLCRDDPAGPWRVHVVDRAPPQPTMAVLFAEVCRLRNAVKAADARTSDCAAEAERWSVRYVALLCALPDWAHDCDQIAEAGNDGPAGLAAEIAAGLAAEIRSVAGKREPADGLHTAAHPSEESP